MSPAKPPIPQAIAQAAADWIVRRDGQTLSPAEDEAFAAWLAEPAHRDAFERLEKLWAEFDADPEEATPEPLPLPVLPPQLPQALQPLAEQRPASPRRVDMAPRRKRSVARRWVSAGIAASLALVLLGALQDWPTRLGADYATGVGGRRTITLADGSRIALDSSSAIKLDFSGKRRGVRLLAGAAMFQVAPDPLRPFTVEAAGGSATALGTAFAVRSHDGVAELVVTHHSVRADGNGRSQVVGEGQRADFGAATLSRIQPADENATAWTRGRLVVVDRPLGEVIAHIARYRHGYLNVTGAAADLRVSGVYDIDHPLAAIDSIQHSLGLASFRVSDRIIILHR